LSGIPDNVLAASVYLAYVAQESINPFLVGYIAFNPAIYEKSYQTVILLK